MLGLLLPGMPLRGQSCCCPIDRDTIANTIPHGQFANDIDHAGEEESVGLQDPTDGMVLVCYCHNIAWSGPDHRNMEGLSAEVDCYV
jgi:hypothetical protein